MDLKNALAVCLISLFSATLVVLIARALDLQAAARLEPQLVAIVEELQTLRKQGGLATAPAGSVKNAAVDDGLVVYYFHSNTRCPTCQAIESQSHDTVQADFAGQIGRGEIVWKVLNYEQSANEALAKKFDVQMPVIVLARMKGGQMQVWKRLDQVWALVGKKADFAAYIRAEVQGLLAAEKPAAASTLVSPSPVKLPLPGPKAALPLPK